MAKVQYGINWVASLDSTHVVTAGHKELRVWDISSGGTANCERVLQGHQGIVHFALHLRCPGPLLGHLVSGGDHTLRLWDLGTAGEEVHCTQSIEVPGKYPAVACGLELQDGNVATGGGDGKIRLWNIGNQQMTQVLASHQDACSTLAQMADGRLVSGGDDGMIMVWDIHTGSCTNTLVGHRADVRCIIYLKNGWLLSGSKDGVMWLWDGQLGSQYKWEGHRDCIHHLLQLPSGDVLSCGGYQDRTLRLWDVSAKDPTREKATFQGHRDAVLCMVALENGRLVSVGNDSTMRMWNISEALQIHNSASSTGCLYLPTASLWHALLTCTVH